MKKTLEQGFTTLEILVTVIIASMFIITFFEMFTDIVKSNGTITRHVIADDFAYSKLKKYTASSNSPNIWFVCTTNSDALVILMLMVLLSSQEMYQEMKLLYLDQQNMKLELRQLMAVREQILVNQFF